MRITDKLVRAGLEKMDRELGVSVSPEREREGGREGEISLLQVPSSTLLSLTGYLDLQQKTCKTKTLCVYV